MKSWLKRKWTLKEAIDIIQAISLIVGLFFIWYQIRSQSHALAIQNAALKLQTKAIQDNQKINAANFIFKLDGWVEDTRYEKVIDAIEDHNGSYKVISGKVPEPLVEEYIGIFQTRADFVNDKLISKNMAYDEFGYDLEKAWCNHDVRNIVYEARKSDKDMSGAHAYFIGFEKLAKYCLARDKKTCSDMDKE